MRLPNHIVLDFESSPKNNGNWYQEFVSQKQSYSYVFDSLSMDRKFLPRRQKDSSLLAKQEKYTLKHSRSFQKYKLNKLNLTFNFNNNKQLSFYSNTLKNLVNINFLRKERLYTKLKYSRSPAYDIVSGGAAALLAGFLGFLVSEKYGFELVDSGDFYYAFMYLVFLGFSLRPLLTSIDYNDSFRNIFSIKLFINFYLNLIYYFFKRR